MRDRSNDHPKKSVDDGASAALSCPPTAVESLCSLRFSRLHVKRDSCGHLILPIESTHTLATRIHPSFSLHLMSKKPDNTKPSKADSSAVGASSKAAGKKKQDDDSGSDDSDVEPQHIER